MVAGIDMEKTLPSLLPILGVVGIPIGVIAYNEYMMRKTKTIRLPLLGEVAVPAEVMNTVNRMYQVTPEEAIKVVAKTRWARGWAQRMASAIYTPGTPEYERAVEKLAEWIARRVLE